MAQDVKIRISVDGQQNASAAVKKLSGDFTGLQSSVERSERAAASATDSLARMGTAVAGLAAATVSVTGLTRAADAWNQLNAQLKIATGTAESGAAAYADVLRIATATGQSLEQVGTVYRRFAENADALNLSQARVADISTTVAQAMALSGGAAESAQGALIQFGQALASGRLRGEELNSVMEQAPRLAQALADGLGISKGALRDMAADGELTSEAIVSALERTTAKVGAEFAQLPLTIGRALQNVSTAWTDTVGSFEQSTGAFGVAAQALDGIARSMDAAVTGAGTLAAVVGGRMVASLTASTQATLADLRAQQAQRAMAASNAQGELRRAEANRAAAMSELEKARAAVAATAAGAEHLAVQRAAILADREHALALRAQAAAALHATSTAATLSFAIATKRDATREATVAARLMTETERALAAVEAEEAAIAARVVAMRHAQTAATGKAAAATEALAVSQAAAATTGAAAATGAGLASRAMGLLGGPVGIVTTALTLGAVAWMTWGKDTDQATARAAQAAEQNLDSIIVKLTELNDRLSSASRSTYDSVVAAAERELMNVQSTTRTLASQLDALGQAGVRGSPKGVEIAGQIEANISREIELQQQLAAARANAAQVGIDGLNDFAAANAVGAQKIVADQEKVLAAFAKAVERTGGVLDLSNPEHARAYDALNAKLAEIGKSGKKAARGTREANDAIEDLLLKLDAKEIEEAAKAVDDYNRAWSDYLGDLDKTARGLDEQIELYGMTEAQIAAVTLARAEDRLEMARASEGVQDDYLAALEREVELRRQIATSSGQLEVLDANKTAAEEAARDWERTSAAIEDALIDALMDGGKSGAEYIEGLFRTMVLRPVLQAVVSPVANAITGILGFGAPSSGGTGGTNLLGTANSAYSFYNGASNLYNTGAIGYQWATGTMSGANAAGTLYANATGTGMDGLFASTGWGTSGSAAGASGMMSSLASAGAYAAIALAVVSLIGDIFGDDPDPRLRYKMSNDFDSAGGWEDGVAYAEGAFGFVGLDDATSKDVKGRKFKEQIEALAAFDTMLAGFMIREEIAAVRSGMDGWMSSANRDTRDYRRDPELALAERLVAISESAGGAQWEEVLGYIRGTQLGSDTGWVTDENGWVTQPDLLPDGTTIADLFGKDALVTAFADVGEAGASALQSALRRVAAESVMDPNHPDFVGSSQGWLDEQVAALIGDMPQSLDDLSVALQGFGLTVEEIERIAIDAANAPFGTGRAGARAANAAQLDGEALAQYILRGFQADNVQSMLEKVGQDIGRDAARAWMDASTTTVVGEDGKETSLDGYGVLMGNLAQGYALLYQTAADTWGQAQESLADMFGAIDAAMPASIDGFKALAEAQDLNTEAGRALYVELMALAPAFVDFAAAQQALYDQLLTDEQRMARATADVSAAFADLGVALPATRDEMRALVDAQDTTTEAGARLRAQLLGLVPAFVEVSDSAAAAAAAAAESSIRAAQDAEREAQRAVADAKSALRAAYARESGELQRTIDQFDRFAKSLRSFREQLWRTQASPLDTQARYGEVARQFEDVARRARLGDVEAIEQLQDISSAYLDVSREASESAEDYYRRFASVQRVLDSTESLAQRQADVARQQLDALTRQVSALITINDSVISVKDAIVHLQGALQAAMAAQKAAMAAQEAAMAAQKAAAPAMQPYSVNDTPAERRAKVEAQTGVTVSSQDPALVAAAKVLYQSINGGASMAQYNAAAAAVGGNIAAAVGWDGSREGAEKLRQVYGFASGGYHTGGLRLVGENGPELEVTGPSRIYSAEQTRDLLRGSGNDELIAELRALRAENAQLRAEVRAIAKYTHDSAKVMNRWEGEGLPETREVAA